MDDQERIQFILDTVGADTVVKDLGRIELGLDKVQKKYKDMGLAQGLQADSALAQAARQAKAMKDQEAQINAVFQATRKLNLESNQMLIVGYSLTRVFGGFFKDLIESYTKLTTTQNSVLTNSITPLNKALIGLTASFEFLKFSLVEAASGPIQFVAEALTSLFEFLANTDPEVLEAIAIGIGAIAAAGVLLIGGGEVLKGIALWKEFLATASNGTTAQGISTLSTNFQNFVNTAKLLVGTGLMIDVGLRLANDFKDGKKIGVTEAIGNALEAGVAAKLLMKSESGGIYAFAIVLGMELAENPDLGRQLYNFVATAMTSIASLISGLALKIVSEVIMAIANTMGIGGLAIFEPFKKIADTSTADVIKMGASLADKFTISADTAAKSTQKLSDKVVSLAPNFETLSGNLVSVNDKMQVAVGKVIPNYSSALDGVVSNANNMTAAFDKATAAIQKMNAAMSSLPKTSIPDIGVPKMGQPVGTNVQPPLDLAYHPGMPMGSTSHG